MAKKDSITSVVPAPVEESLPPELVAVARNEACFAIDDQVRVDVVLGDDSGRA